MCRKVTPVINSILSGDISAKILLEYIFRWCKIISETKIWKTSYRFWRGAGINYPETNEFTLNLLGSRRNIIHLALFCQENDSRVRQDNRVAVWMDIYVMKVESRRQRWFARRLNFEVESPRVVSVSHNIIYTSYSCSVIHPRYRSQATWIVHPRFIYLKRFENMSIILRLSMQIEVT